MDASDFLDEVRGYVKRDAGTPSAADRPVRLGTVSELYSSGLVLVRFDGETELGTKGYASLSSYNPQPGERVALLPVGSSYLIIGKVDPSPRQFPEWEDFAPALRNGWLPSNIAGFQATPEIIRSSDGWVKLKGLVRAGGTADEALVATLPVGYRPTGQLHLPTVSSVDGATAQPAMVRVRPDGQIRAGFGVAAGWLSLDSITFVAES